MKKPSKKQLAARRAFIKMVKSRSKKNVKRNQSHTQKETPMKRRKKHSKKSAVKTSFRHSGGGSKHRSRSHKRSGGGAGKFNITKILTQVAVSVAMIFGVTYLVNMVLNKFNLSADKANIAKWAFTLGIPGLALFFAKKYPMVQAAAVASIAYAVFNWSKTMLPATTQAQLAGVPGAPEFSPMIPSGTGHSVNPSGALVPAFVNN